MLCMDQSPYRSFSFHARFVLLAVKVRLQLDSSYMYLDSRIHPFTKHGGQTSGMLSTPGGSNLFGMGGKPIGIYMSAGQQALFLLFWSSSSRSFHLGGWNIWKCPVPQTGTLIRPVYHSSSSFIPYPFRLYRFIMSSIFQSHWVK